MKETNVWLSSEELQHLLQGLLQWNDVASRVPTSKTGMRKLGATIWEKQVVPKPAAYPVVYPPKEKDTPVKRLEGQPVIWLLGSVGLLTLSSWFYFVLLAK